MTCINLPNQANHPKRKTRERLALKGLLQPAALAATLLMSISAWAQGGGGAGAQDGPQHLPTIRLGAGMFNIQTELATTPEQREIGLMHRTTLGAYEGMLFVFDSPATQCFWMKNTLIPLSVAFIANDGSIVNIDEMKPETLNPHCSAQPVRFVLEMNQSWFTKHDMKAGSKLTGMPFGTGKP